MVLIAIAIPLLLCARCDDQPQSVSIVAAGDMAATLGREPARPGVPGESVHRRVLQTLALSSAWATTSTRSRPPRVRDRLRPPGAACATSLSPRSATRRLLSTRRTPSTPTSASARGRPGYWSVEIVARGLPELNCTVVTGWLWAGSPQQQVAAENLAAKRQQAHDGGLHHPRWSNGIAGSDARMGAFLRDAPGQRRGHPAVRPTRPTTNGSTV